MHHDPESAADRFTLSVEVHHRRRGRPIIALHGFASTRESWRGLVPHLGGRELWLFDLKGHGASPSPKDGSYSVQAQADLVLARIISEDLRDLTIVGHSFGGAVALFLSIALIKEGRGRLNSLVLIDSLYHTDALPRWARVALAASPIALALQPVFTSSKWSALAFMRLAMVIVCRHPERIAPAALVSYADNLCPPRLGAMISTLRELVPALIVPLSETLSVIDVPTLILWGREDRLLPWKSAATTLHRAIPGSTLCVVDDCGHIPHEEQRDAVLRKMVPFLATDKPVPVVPQGSRLDAKRGSRFDAN